MQGRIKADMEDLQRYTQRMWDFSGYMLSRPNDGATDAAGNVSIGMGTSRPYNTVGLCVTDIESSLRSLDVPLGKYGHQAQVIHNTRMIPAGGGAPAPSTSVPRLLFPARDSKSAPAPVDPGPPVPNPMPIYSAQNIAGSASRQQLRDTFGFNV